MWSKSNCTFCKIARGRRPAAIVWQDGDFMCLIDKYPMNLGHSLVMPKKHYALLTEMPISEVGKLFECTARVSRAIFKALKPDGVNIGQSNGKAASQTIFHVHVHIVPRFEGDAKRGFWPQRKRFTEKQLNEMAKKIGKAIETT